MAAIAAFITRIPIIFDRYLYHLEDYDQDVRHNLFCKKNDIAPKYIEDCMKAASGINQPVVYRAIRDMISITMSQLYDIVHVILGVAILGVFIFWATRKKRNYYIPITLTDNQRVIGGS